LLALLLLALPPRVAAATVAVTIDGIEGEPLANVRAALSLLQRRDEDLEPETIRRLHAQGREEIRRALQPFAFYRPDISATLDEPAAPGAGWTARYDVDAGDPLPLAEVAMTVARQDAAHDDLAALVDALPLRPGDALDHRHYESAKQTLLEQVQRLGYLDADYSVHRVEVDLKAYAATVMLTLQPGPRYVFGPVEFEASRFAPAYLDKYRVIEPGTPFSRDLLAQQRKAISGSGHFREVRVETGEQRLPSDGGPPAIPVRVQLTPFAPNRYRGRLGWGTETGFGAQLDWNRRHFGSRGHRFNLGGTAVQERERIAADLRYRIPLEPLSDHNFELGLRHESKDLNFEDVELDEGGATRIAANFATLFWNLPRSRLGPFDLRAAAGVGLVGESYDVFRVLFGNLADDAQASIIDFIGAEALDTLAPDFRAVVPEVRLSLRRSDALPFIRRGDYLGLRLLGAEEALGANISFWQARLSHWSIFPLGERSRLITRTALGYSEAESREVLGVTFNQMPEFYEFRGGGARNIRGYGFETLFPEDGITGGRHQVIGSVEYEREIIPDWSAAFFVDGGNVFNKAEDFEAKYGAGFGVRWRSPVGPVRVDVGFPLDDADSAFQLYISVGPEF